jgi:hypothetical protein
MHILEQDDSLYCIFWRWLSRIYGSASRAPVRWSNNAEFEFQKTQVMIIIIKIILDIMVLHFFNQNRLLQKTYMDHEEFSHLLTRTEEFRLR